MAVTNTVGEYRKLAQADNISVEYYIYQARTEPVSTIAVSSYRFCGFFITHPILLRFIPPNASTIKGIRLTLNSCFRGSSPIPPLLKNELLDMLVGQVLASFASSKGESWAIRDRNGHF